MVIKFSIRMYTVQLDIRPSGVHDISREGERVKWGLQCGFANVLKQSMM